MSAISGVAPESARSSQPIPPILVLRDLPGIAAIEAASGVRGIEWKDDYLRRCDAASRALFGITEAQTRPPRPDRHTYDAPDAAFAGMYTPDAFRSYDAAYDAWSEWCGGVNEAEAFILTARSGVMLNSVPVDTLSAAGDPLKCLPRFVRQLVVASAGIHADAKLTPESAAPDHEAWGSALEAEAARFKSRR